MTAITWSETLALQQPRMDQTHQEFVALLQALDAAVDEAPDSIGTLLDELQAHTVEHFNQEERWMADIGFAPENCHQMQHGQVLHVLGEVRRVMREEGGKPELARVLAEELGKWFVAHAQMMDASLAELMVQRGYDPETRTLRQPLAAEAAPITGCGGGSCS